MVVGNIQKGTDFNWEFLKNVRPNFGGVENDFAEIETDVERPKLVNNDGVISVIERPDTEAEIKQFIKDELNELEKTISSDVEDIWEAINKKPPQEAKKQAIERKKFLREQLKGLEG